MLRRQLLKAAFRECRIDVRFPLVDDTGGDEETVLADKRADVGSETDDDIRDDVLTVDECTEEIYKLCR